MADDGSDDNRVGVELGLDRIKDHVYNMGGLLDLPLVLSVHVVLLVQECFFLA